MSYKVLARKWRPKKFSDIVGQKHIVQAITHSFLLNKIHHAYILSGTRGIGKTTIARLLAKGLNCEQGVTPVMCGQCNNCKDIESGSFIDLVEIDAASRTKVEDTREFLDNVQYMPSRGRFKIYLIDEVHMLSRHSFNALLKTLEEPPEHVKFVLVTTEHQKLPETILSRCLQFYLKPLNISQIITQLTYIFDKEKINIEASALELLAHASKGSMRDALSLSEQAIVLGNNNITNNVINNMFGLLNIEHPLCLIENLIDGNIHDIMNQIDNYSALGVNWDHFLSEMLSILQKIAMNQFLSNPIQKEYNNSIQEDIKQRILKLSNRINPENIQLYYQILLLGRKELPYTPNQRMGMEMTMLRAIAFRPDINITNQNNNNISSKVVPSNNNPVFNANNTQYAIDHIDTKSKDYDESNNASMKTELKKKDNTVQLNLRKSECDSDHNKLNISTTISKIDIVETTSKILEARSKLLQYKKSNKLNTTKTQSNLNLKSQKTIKNLLERFSNITTRALINDSNHTDKIKKNMSKNLEFNKDCNDIEYFYKNHTNTPDIIRKVIQEAMEHDPWTLQIYQLSLPESAKKLIMNSWKEEISSNEICLHVRLNYQHLNSIALCNIIQESLSKNMGIPIKLHIKKDNNHEIKTPMEYICVLYAKKVSQIQQKLSNDSNIETLLNFFDAEYDIHSIKIL